MVAAWQRCREPVLICVANANVMEDRWVKEQIEVIRKGTKQVTATKESARQFLIRAGILDGEGNLAPAYRAK